MNEEYARQVLRVVLGRVCQPLGVHGMQTSVCDALVDVLRQYLIVLGRTTTSYCTHGKAIARSGLLSGVWWAGNSRGVVFYS